MTDPIAARNQIRSLKRGVCSSEGIEYMTVGRAAEVSSIVEWLNDAANGNGTGGFVEGHYGAGKSHLLKLIEATALRDGFATAWVTINGHSHALSHPTRYIHSLLETLRVPGLALRGLTSVCRYWLSTPLRVPLLKWAARQSAWPHYWALSELTKIGSDDEQSTDRCQAVLEGRDLQRKSGPYYYEDARARLAAATGLCRAAGLKGIVFLVDEVETTATLLANIRSRLLAYQVIREFFLSGRLKHATAVLATTPDFGHRVEQDSVSHGDYRSLYPEGFRFIDKWRERDVNLIKLAAISSDENRELLERIAQLHQLAFGWKLPEETKSVLAETLLRRSRKAVFSQREVIRSFVNVLELSQQYPNIRLSLETGEVAMRTQAVS